MATYTMRLFFALLILCVPYCTNALAQDDVEAAFTYKNLERAVIIFGFKDDVQVKGFTTETGRVEDLVFVKE